VVDAIMVDRMETNPFEAIRDGDFVTVDAGSETIEVRRGKS
jgi:hypothetical protein